MRIFYPVILAAAVGLSSTAQAQDATPNHVFQVTEQIVQELKALNAENFSQAAKVSLPKDGTQPRHVLFLVRDQWRKVQLLRFINGLDNTSLPPETVHAVTPSEVKEQVDKLLLEVQALRSAYGLGNSQISVALPTGKKPVDVYGNLLRISAELDALGVPSTVPNDVFRVAASLVSDLETLAAQNNVFVARTSIRKARGRTPADAYKAALELIAALDKVTADNSKFSVKGGVSVPAAKQGPKSPSDVIVVLSRAQADVMAIMNTAKAGSKVTAAPYMGGKTPSDVYNSIVYARHLVEALAS